jgi:hypothetical protein
MNDVYSMGRAGRRALRWCGGPVAPLVVALLALGAITPTVQAQANLSTQGFGYPTGQLSTQAYASGGGLGEFDAQSALNPAALGTVTRATIHIQYDPEFRSVSTPYGTDNTTTIRFPMLTAALPITSRFVLGVSFSTLLDRTWETTQTGQTAVGDTLVTSTEKFKSAGGIEDLQLDGGWSPVDALHFGLGFHVYTGQNQITVGRVFPDTTVVKALPFSESNTYNYLGTGLSLGTVVRPSSLFAIAASIESGGILRVHRNDTLQSKASVPPRAGAGIRYDGISGVTISANADWEGWSRMDGLGSAGLVARDAWNFGGGVEVAGPRVADRGTVLRVGAQTRTLPFLADGVLVRENDIAGGIGVPLAGPRSSLDLTLQRALRSAPIGGISEAAWLVSLGMTIRP